jgi:hypothetical protein
MKRTLNIIFILLLVQGCASLGESQSHKDFYRQVAPTKYPPTEETMVFKYGTVNLETIYDLLFSDFLIIGRSHFNGPYEDPMQSVSYAKSIGANVFVTTYQFQETTTSFIDTGSFIAPIRVHRYDQSGLFLKNVSGSVPLWERTEAHYKRTESSNLEGAWFNEHYKINLYRSGQYLVAFMMENSKKHPIWEKGQLNFIYNINSGAGFILMADKTPLPANFALNKFGHLEGTTLKPESFSFSFARQL